MKDINTKKIKAPSSFSPFVLYMGDLMMIILFTAIGSMEHHLNLTIGSTLMVAFPFLATWTLFAILLQAYTQKSRSRDFRGTALLLLQIWALGLPTGLVLRFLLFGKPLFSIFGPLAFVFIYLFILVWRILYSYTPMWSGRRNK